MRRLWGAASVATAMALTVGFSQGQPPAAPTAGVPGAGPGAAQAGVGVAPTAAAEKAGFFKRMCIGLDECRRKLCRTPAGQLMNGMVSPLSGLTGGVIPPFCPLMPSDKDLQKPGVAGAAAAAQKEALEAKARRDAVRFLGTLDCRYFPDAAVQLAAALRTDSSECVRFEAALVLGHGCCCTQRTVEALEASVSGMEYDGNPAERSVRVRCAAAIALEGCLSCYTPPPVEVPVKDPDGVEIKPKKDEIKPLDLDAPKKLPVTDPGKTSLSPGQRLPNAAAIEKARKTLNEFNALLAAYQPMMVAQPMGSQSDRQSVYHILKGSAGSPASAQQQTMNAVAAASYWSPESTAKPTPVNVPQTANLMAPTPMEPPHRMEPSRPLVPNPMPIAPTSPTLGTPMPVSIPAPMPETRKVVSVPSPMQETPKAASMASPTPEMPKAPALMPAIVPSTSVVAVPPVEKKAVTPAGSMTSVPTTDPTAAEVYDWAKKSLQSTTAADRHAAIRQLVRFDWKQHPLVASALLAGAKSDPVDAVRVDCMRHLAAYKINHPQVITGLEAMANDVDPWVRQEVHMALGQLKALK